eukprot:CAMPEP_0176345206 /NCGR_PEP_ID=MMETSP0126-20121128/5278_1 /TAXON_ID=141414 ORGANISM="Strombidinopsis acuminatum, Strain SPMC142" /NCGR_SAMPLE_ID=MMETSP0126 /ASSEMBLY_ACC=CAM_ASM_000229 /LENGTH=48 /DNA_ID= /DNA_START= /DNA_END= /DNA_ORIENTATION=
MHKIDDFMKKHTDGKSFLSGTDQASMLDIHVYVFVSMVMGPRVPTAKE